LTLEVKLQGVSSFESLEEHLDKAVLADFWRLNFLE
jgi:hypothetical protein